MNKPSYCIDVVAILMVQSTGSYNWILRQSWAVSIVDKSALLKLLLCSCVRDNLTATE